MAKIVETKKGVFSCRFWYNDRLGQQKSKYKSGFPSKRAANDWATLLKLELECSKDNNDGKLRFGKLADEWLTLKEINRSPTTLRSYKEIIELLKTYIKDCDIQKIDETVLQEIIKTKKDKPRYCQLIASILTNIFNYAIRKRYVRENPAMFLELPIYEPQEKEVLNTDSAQKILGLLRQEAADSKSKYGYLYNYTLLSLMFSMSRAEVCARTFADIKNNSIFVRSNYVAVGGKRITKNPKAKSRYRKLSIDDEIINELKIYHSAHHITPEYICCFKDGQPLHPDTVTKKFASFLKENKLPHIPFKNLRHSFGNITLEQGSDLDTLKRLMGHSRIETTSRYYLQDNQKLMKNTINKTQNVLLQHNKND